MSLPFLNTAPGYDEELRDEAVQKYHAIQGGQQTLSNLAAYVTEIVRKGVED